MLGQDQGADKTNVGAGAPKVILSGGWKAPQTSRKGDGVGRFAGIGKGRQIWMSEINPSAGLQEFRKGNPRNPALVPNIAKTVGTFIYG